MGRSGRGGEVTVRHGMATASVANVEEVATFMRLLLSASGEQVGLYKAADERAPAWAVRPSSWWERRRSSSRSSASPLWLPAWRRRARRARANPPVWSAARAPWTPLRGFCGTLGELRACWRRLASGSRCVATLALVRKDIALEGHPNDTSGYGTEDEAEVDKLQAQEPQPFIAQGGTSVKYESEELHQIKVEAKYGPENYCCTLRDSMQEENVQDRHWVSSCFIGESEDL
ncbi:unnamed protein product [Prorocentrum cordatum]|uniref:Uncharacterized protein n=1 Tax=Prorocentrum cordatum TaxID=2364126 RepID=A0ABN9WRU0_9DINO|nr:unnamed protein product [Polarella glacialis]